MKEKINLLIVGMVFLIINTLSWGFVCFKFWDWFILPVFTELPIISFFNALGLMFFISLFKNKDLKPEKYENEYEMYYSIFTPILIPWFTILIGYLFKVFIY